MIDLTAEQLATIKRILAEKVPGREVRAFGSRVRWETKPYSDLDLAVMPGTTPLPKRSLSQLKEAFEESDLPFSVDVVDWQSIGEGFRKIIEREFEVIQAVGADTCALHADREESCEGGVSAMSCWQPYLVEEVATDNDNALSTGPFGSSISSRYFQSEGVPVIRGSNLSEDIDIRLDDEGLVFVSGNKASEFKRSIVRHGDLVFTCWGTITQVGLVDDRATYPEYVISNKQMKLTPDPAKADGLFLYYLFSSPKLRNEIKNKGIGSSIPGFNLGQLRKMKILLPPPPEQNKIAEILSSLDEKIELNRKQNRTLEAIVQALFKRWFIAFEFPDENGRPYKSSGGDMQPSELGEIPVGWRIGKLEELIGELETGSRPKGGVGQFTDGIPSIGAESITRIGEYDFGKTKYVPEEYFNKMRRGTINNRDVLIYKDGGTPGRFDARISMFGGGFPFETACINEHVFRVQAKNPLYQNYLYLWLSSYPVLEELRHRGAKAAIPGINSNDVKELDFLFMDEVVLEKFDEVIEPLFAKLLRNSREMAVLARLRDALLPKLMSGELRVA